MARTDAFSMLDGAAGKASLAEAYGGVIDGIQKSALSAQLKTTRYSGDATTGSVEVARFKNSASKAYGTARTAGAGDKLANAAVTINLSTKKEIVEEVENNDALLGTVSGIIGSRTGDHAKTLIRELDTAFFTAITSISGAEVTPAVLVGDLEGQLEKVIQSLETKSNDYVDGIDRDMITVTMLPAVYGALRTKFDTIIGVNGESIPSYHGVRVASNHRQAKDFVAVVEGSVAQPVVVKAYAPTNIELSDAAAICLFYQYGTKVVAEDLVAWSTLSTATS